MGITIRDKWVDFIKASLAATTEESDTSQTENDSLSSFATNTATNSMPNRFGTGFNHQRVHSYSFQHQRRGNGKVRIGKHNRTQSMTAKSRSTTFDVSPVHVTVTYNIKEDKIEQFLSALKPMIIATNKEKGCVRFNIHQDKGEKSKFIMMEEWKSQRYLTMHLKSEHLKKYRERTKNHNVHKSIPEVFFCSELMVV